MTCTCANPEQWLEVNCPEHGEYARAQLTEQAELPPAPTPELLPAPTPEVEELEIEEEEPPLPKEISWYGKPMMRLTPAAEIGARIDAWGASRKEIAERLEVSPLTVSRWRRSPVYIEARRLEMVKVIEDAKQRMQRDKQGAFQSREEARAMLTQMLEASDPDGHALYGVRAAAAKILMEDKAATSEFAETKVIEGTIKAVGAVFHIHEDGSVVPDAAPPSGEIIDGEAEEVGDGTDR